MTKDQAMVTVSYAKLWLWFQKRTKYPTFPKLCILSTLRYYDTRVFKRSALKIAEQITIGFSVFQIHMTEL